MSCGGSFFILIAACADITRDVRGLCQNSSLDIVQNNEWLKCWQMLSWWVRLLLFFLSISNCDIPVTVHGHSKRWSKQFPRGAYLCSMIVRMKYFLPLHLMVEADLPSSRCTMHAFLMLYEKAHQL